MEMDFGLDWCWSRFRGLFFTSWVNNLILSGFGFSGTIKQVKEETKKEKVGA